MIVVKPKKKPFKFKGFNAGIPHSKMISANYKYVKWQSLKQNKNNKNKNKNQKNKNKNKNKKKQNKTKQNKTKRNATKNKTKQKTFCVAKCHGHVFYQRL